MRFPSALLLLAAAALLAGCASTRLTNAWKDPAFQGPAFTKVMVMGVSNEAGTRRTFEDVFSASLMAAGVIAVPSYTLIPEDGEVGRDRLKEAVQRAGAEGVLVTRIVRVDRRTQFSPGYVTAVPAVGFYRDFYGFYSSAWTFHTPPQVVQFDVMTLETNLWSMPSGNLVWSGTTETFAPGDVRTESEVFARVVIGALRERGLI